MQSQPRLQEVAVFVVINFLARQRGSYVTRPCLPAIGKTIPAPTTAVSLTRWYHVRRCLLSHRRLSAAATCHSLPSLTLSVADWTFTRLICLTGGLGDEEAGTLAASTASVAWGIQWYGLYSFYFAENVIMCGV